MIRTQIVDRVNVRALSRLSLRGRVNAGTLELACTLGSGGIRHDKREGDGATPAGTFAMRCAFYRADRLLRPRTGLPLRPLRPDDGWCDDPASGRYNRFVRHPFDARAEKLWRDDGLYDVLVILDQNDCPLVRGRGSAVFIHAAAPGYAPTAGCVGLARDDLIRLLAHVGCHTRLAIA